MKLYRLEKISDILSPHLVLCFKEGIK